MRYKKINHGEPEISVIGQGTMGIGGYLTRDESRDEDWIKTLRLGIKLGMTLIDTAEVYGAGHSEELVGRAVQGMRERVFIATKFSPEHARYQDVILSAERSLQRLRTEYIDLYQIHWPNPALSIEESMEAMRDLLKSGKIRYIGVSNFSLSQLKEAQQVLGEIPIFSNQTEYNLFDRFVEKDILPYCEKENIYLIAYSPLNQGSIVDVKQGMLLQNLAEKYQKTAAQIVLNWLVSHRSVVAIPKATREVYVKENAAAADFIMSKEDYDEIGKVYAKEPLYVPVKEINVSVQGQGARRTYQTLKEALANSLNFVPSPHDLAVYMRAHPEEEIKPVRLRYAAIGAEYEFELVEGRIRYWAWVIAHKGEKSIPAYIRM